MNRYFAILILMILLSACREDFEIETVVEATPDAPVVISEEFVEGRIGGVVIDKNGNPVSGALIRYGEFSRLTDLAGYFVFSKVLMDPNGTNMTVEKSGYFDHPIRIYPTEGSTSYLRIRLLEKLIAGNFPASEGGKITLRTGASIAIQGNAIADEEGRDYFGQVNVMGRWLDPTDSRLGEIMPGRLEGRRRTGEAAALASFGMLAVELYAPEGQSLQLREGQEAELVFPIPESLLAGAPAVLPLWYFDEEKGIWIEEGEAQMIGTNYVGTVKHFSYWNCDAPFRVVDFQARIRDQFGNPLSQVKVEICMLEGAASGSDLTNDEGIVKGKFPADERLRLKVVSNHCDAVMHEVEIGPFSEHVDLLDVEVNLTEGAAKFTGKLLDCQAGQRPTLLLEFATSQFSSIFFPDEEGAFREAVYMCDATEFKLRAVDLVGQKYGKWLSVSLQESAEGLTLEVCEDALDEFMTIAVDSTIYVYEEVLHDSLKITDIDNDLSANHLMVGKAVIEGRVHHLEVEINDLKQGSWRGRDQNASIVLWVSENIITLPGELYWYIPCWTDCSDFTVNIEASGKIGEPIIGRFTGQVPRIIENGGDTIERMATVNGAFKVIRKY